MDIQYNSWLTKFKNPFGAIKKGEGIDFKIKVASKERLKSVKLIVKKVSDSIEINEYVMSAFEQDYFRYHFQVTKGSGLYLYCFKVTAYNEKNEEFCLYYGKSDMGGLGYQYVNEASINWYQITCYEREDNAPNWYQDAIVYQIFPDRFYNGNPKKEVNHPKKNSFLYGTEEDLPLYIKDSKGDIIRWDFYGGNLKGIEAKIPYLKELGVTVLYLNPIFEATSNHRYDTNDYFKIDPVLGTNDDFLDLVNELHKNDMRIILDGVFSHVGRNSQYFNYSGFYGAHEGAYQSPHSKYYDWFTFYNYPDDYKSWWGIADLPQINKNNKSYQQFIYCNKNSVLSFWQYYNIDGWRLDVADELPNFFLKGIRTKLNEKKDVVLLGEVWEDASNKVAYEERKEYCSHPILHGVMNYPLRESILNLVNEREPIENTISKLMVQKENYPMYFSQNCLNSISTHDTKRILNECHQSIEKVSLAVSILFCMPGVPCIYYGDEVGLAGEKDPDNRRFYPWNNPNKVLKQICQNWITLRKSHESLTKGECHFFHHPKKQLFGIYRSVTSEESLCLFNFSQFEQVYQEDGWESPDIATVQVFEIMKRFNIPRLNVTSEHHLFLVRQLFNKEEII